MGKLESMKTTHSALVRAFASHANDRVKLAFEKKAARRWLEDDDLMKLCKLSKRCRESKKSSK